MYGTDAATIYDAQHEARGKNFRAEAGEVARQVRSHRPDATSLLDVACGTGAHLEVFAEHYPDTAGLEISAPMLEIARRRVPTVPLHAGDMRNFDLGRRFDVVVCLFASIAYAGSPEGVDATVDRLARHLTPGGVVVVEPWWFADRFLDGHVSGDVVRAGDTTISRLSRTVRADDTSVMTVHTVVADADAIRHFTDVHRALLLDRDRYELAFRRAGLAVSYVPDVASGRGLLVGTAPVRVEPPPVGRTVTATSA
ncbi:MAG: class I SAM-dependent methyltransferase [Pseudonocardia sp.]|nr:class I SAM-dependent methyltransferase [Pseudonocardia sp.]